MSDLTEEETDAVATLAKRGRLVVIIVPPGVPDGFVARLTSWSNFVLDTRLMPPMGLPVRRKGDGLVCPYCGVPATAKTEAHLPACDWARAFRRWAMAQAQIDLEFGEA